MTATAAAAPKAWVELKDEDFPEALIGSKKVIRHEPTGHLAEMSFTGVWSIRDPNDIERKVAVMHEEFDREKPGAWAKSIVSMLTEPQKAYRLVTNENDGNTQIAITVFAGHTVDLCVNVNEYDHVPVAIEHLLRITQHYWIRCNPPACLLEEGEEIKPTVFRIIAARPL